MALPVKQKKSPKSFISRIIHLPQSLLIWCAGAKRQDLPKHLRNPYAGLGAMAMVSTTLATLGGYSFVLISIGSATAAVPGAILAGYFMWGMDRSVLGSPGVSNSQRQSPSNNDLKKGLWIKLAVNVAFSSILTLPLSVYIQRGAVQKHNMNLITADIEKVEREIDKQNNEIAVVQEKKEKIDANWKLGGLADGSRNEAYFEDKEEARQAVIEAKAEKATLVEDKKNLKAEYAAYERGDLTKVSLSFPEQFYHMMSQARWTDNLLNLSFFTITALMGSGAVLIKTFVFGADSYTRKLQGLEEAAIYEQEVKSALNISAQQVYGDLFDTGVGNERLKTKLQRLQREFDSEVERMATWLYDERTKKMQQYIIEQAVSEDIQVDYKHFNPNPNNSSNKDLKQGSREHNSPQVTQPQSKYRKRSPSEKRSSSNSLSSKISNFKQNSSFFDNGKQVARKKASSKTASQSDFMTLFGDVERKISQKKEMPAKNNKHSYGEKHPFQ